MATILVVAEETALLRRIEEALAQAAFDVRTARSGAEAIRIIGDVRVDLVVLDPTLRDVSGLDLCRALTRADRARDILILIVSERAAEADRIAGFEHGASDYMVAPISVRELVLRVRALLRRAQARPPGPEPIVVNALRIDVAAHRVWVGQGEVELTRLEFRLLVALVEQRPRVQTRGALIQDVWGGQGDVTRSTINTHVTRLREKLGAVGACIETVHGTGYRFSESPVRSAESAEARRGV